MVEHAGPPKSTFADMKAKIDPDDARYILIFAPYELKGRKEKKIAFITYLGPGADMREKMEYRSTEKKMIKNFSTAFRLQLNSYDDLDLETISAAILKSAD